MRPYGPYNIQCLPLLQLPVGSLATSSVEHACLQYPLMCTPIPATRLQKSPRLRNNSCAPYPARSGDDTSSEFRRQTAKRVAVRNGDPTSNAL